MKKIMSLRGAVQIFKATKQSLRDCFALLVPQGLAALAMTIVCVNLLTGCNAQPKQNKACFKNTCYIVELAISEEEKTNGLKKRETLDKDKGMLFVFDGRSSQKFWMKDTVIPLDMLWLDYDGKIVYIEHAASPCEKDPCPVFGPNARASYVLEINAAQAAEHDMRVGDRIDIRIPQDKF